MVRHEPVLDLDDADDDEAYVYRRPARKAQPRYARDAAYGADELDDLDRDELAYGDDEPQSLIDRVLAAPGKLAMTAVALVAFVAVGVNAAYMQPGAHPSPMLSTRDGAPALALQQVDGRLPERSITAAPAPIVPPNRAYDATASIGTTTSQIAATAPRAPYGPPAPTPRPNFATAPAAPVPAAEALLQTVAQPVAARPVETRSIETLAANDPIAALLAPVVSQQGAGQPLPPAAATRSVQPLVAAVQAVLAEMGYQPGSVDGVIGPSTEEAIRRFQLRRALEPNGQITADLLREIERVTGTRISDS